MTTRIKPTADTYTVVRYEVRQIVLTDDYLAVFAVDAEDGGGLTLTASPVAALGLADEVSEERKHGTGRIVDDPHVERGIVVGLDLAEGWFQVVNDCGNFAGLCRKGDDIWKATGCLRGDYLSRLEKQRRQDGTDGFVEGAQVKHATYGEGQITGVGGYGAIRTARIRFKEGGERTFRLDKAREFLTVIGK